MTARDHERSIGDFADTEGRLLAERGAREIDGHTFDMRACPYDDARRGLDMNIDALRQIRTHWDDVLPAIRTLERDNRHVFGTQVSPLTRLRRLTRVLGSLPEFLVLFQNRRNGSIPALAAVLYKIARGLNTVTTRLTLEEPREIQESIVVQAESLYAYIDRHRLLVGQNEVCAGPKNQILEVLAALCGPADGVEHDNGDAPFDTADALGAMLTEGERYAALRYGVGLSDHLLARALFARIYAVFAAARTASSPDDRHTRGEVARILAMPAIATPDPQPATLDTTLTEVRHLLSSFVIAGPASVQDALVRRIDALWVRTMEDRRREVAGVGVELGALLGVAIRVTDIPERIAALDTLPQGVLDPLAS